jgi:tripartite-type tricarboxylate transporter receptor subunit TctC
MPISRRAGLALGATLAAPRLARAKSFPTRPIRLIVPWPPGGSADVQLRSLAEIASPLLGQPVVVENRAGARGTLGASMLMQSAPDGYTLAQQHLSVIRQPYMMQRPPWDPVSDFTYVIGLTGWLFGVVVRADSPWNSWADCIAAARREPGKLTYSTSGIATTNHLAMEDLLGRERAEMTHVPFRGTTEGITALLGRQIDCIADSSAWAPHVEAGTFRLLCVWSAERATRFPAVPTLRELGHDMVVISPYGLAGPRGMDPEITAVLHDAFKRALFDPANEAARARFDMPLSYLDSADYTQFARDRAAYEKAMVQRLQLRLD